MTDTSPATAEIICAACTDEVPAAPTCDSCGEPTLLENRYRLVEIVGQGSFGTTYRATDTEVDRTVAIKEMLVRSADTLKAVELFEREAEVLESLDHDQIPGYYDDFWREDGRSTAFFLVQQFVDGHLVSDHLGDGPTRPDEVFELLEQLLETLDYLHEFSPPVVHRDVKPSNLMIREADGSVVLIDFGSVQAAIQPEEGGSTVAGTFGYMAPEQFSGRAEPNSDVYGAAATAVGLLAGSEPAPNRGTDATPDVSTLNVGAARRRLLDDMLAADPADRPSAAEAADRLGEPADAPAPGPEPAPESDPQSDADPDERLPDYAPSNDPPRALPPGFGREYTSPLSDIALPALIVPISALLGAVGGVFLYQLEGTPIFGMLFVISGMAAGAAIGTSVRKNHQRPDPKPVWKRGELTEGWWTDNPAAPWKFEVDDQWYYGDFLPTSLNETILKNQKNGSVQVLYLPDDPERSLPVTDSIRERM